MALPACEMMVFQRPHFEDRDFEQAISSLWDSDGLVPAGDLRLPVGRRGRRGSSSSPRATAATSRGGRCGRLRRRRSGAPGGERGAPPSSTRRLRDSGAPPRSARARAPPRPARARPGCAPASRGTRCPPSSPTAPPAGRRAAPGPARRARTAPRPRCSRSTPTSDEQRGRFLPPARWRWAAGAPLGPPRILSIARRTPFGRSHTVADLAVKRASLSSATPAARGGLVHFWQAGPVRFSREALP